MKKIVHIIIACFYKEGYGYQENILPAKHVELGYETHIITNNTKAGKYHRYINKDGVHVHVLEKNMSILKRIPLLSIKVNKTKGLLKTIKSISPDIIFIHGLQAIDNLEVYNYKKNNPKVKIFVDQHGDYYNMPIVPYKYYLLHKLFFKPIAKKLEKISERMWGVTPWRVEYLEKVYNISTQKTGLLVMGGDEKHIDWEQKERIRNEIRKKYNIPQNAFVLISGGKIDLAKNIHLLIDAFNKLNGKNIYLIIFGNYDEETNMICQPMLNERIINIGWIDSKNVYPLFLASDLGVFPGTHSVLWEQLCATGIPAIFKDWDGGMSHVDVGGNCILLKEITSNSLKNTIESIINNKDLYDKMKEIAQSKGRKTFSYIEIAKKAIEINFQQL